MWHLLQLVLRTALAITGAFCLLTACLAYPGEEGQMQSVLEDLWARMDDRQRGMLSAHTVFMQQVAKLASRGFDKLFGHRLFSLRCLGVSVSYSVASYALALFLLNGLDILTYHSSERISLKIFSSVFAISGYVAAGYLFIGSIPSLFAHFRFTRTWLFLILCSVPILWACVFRDPSWTLNQDITGFLTWGIPAMAASFGCDVLFLAATRRSLRWAGEMKKTYKIAALVLLNLAFAWCLVLAPFVWSYADLAINSGFGNGSETIRENVVGDVLFVSGSNTIDLIAACVFVALAALLLIHRALWPLLNRSVFRLQEIGVKGRRAILISLGLMLLGAGTGETVVEWARKAAELARG